MVSPTSHALPVCCTSLHHTSTDADYVAAVPNTITTTDDFTSYCAESGTEARCCVLSLVRPSSVDFVLVTNYVSQLGSDGLLCSGVA